MTRTKETLKWLNLQNIRSKKKEHFYFYNIIYKFYKHNIYIDKKT